MSINQKFACNVILFKGQIRSFPQHLFQLTKRQGHLASAEWNVKGPQTSTFTIYLQLDPTFLLYLGIIVRLVAANVILPENRIYILLVDLSTPCRRITLLVE